MSLSFNLFDVFTHLQKLQKCLAVRRLPKMAIFHFFFLSNNLFLNTDFDFDTSSGKTNGKLQMGMKITSI